MGHYDQVFCVECILSHVLFAFCAHRSRHGCHVSPAGAFANEQPWTLESTTDVASRGSVYLDTSTTVLPFGSLYDSGARIRMTAYYNRYSLIDPSRSVANRGIDFLMGYGRNGSVACSSLLFESGSN